MKWGLISAQKDVLFEPCAICGCEVAFMFTLRNVSVPRTPVPGALRPLKFLHP